MGTVARGAVGLAVLLAAVAYLLNPTNLIYLGVQISACVVAYIGALRAPRGQRLVPHLIAAGLAASVSAELIWFLLERAGEVPDISIADILWFASYPPIAAALWIALVRGEGRGRVNVDMVVDALTIVVISVLTFWSLSISDIVADPSTPAFVRTVWASYPVADAVVLALVLRVLASPRSRKTIDIWFAVGVGCWLAADIGYLLFSDDGTTGTVMDLGWMLGTALMAHSTWRRWTPPVVEADVRVAETRVRRTAADGGPAPPRAAGTRADRGPARP